MPRRNVHRFGPLEDYLVETLDQALCFPTCMPEGEAEAYRAGAAQLYALGHLKQDDLPLGKAADRRSTASPPSGSRAPSYSEEEVAAIFKATAVDVAGPFAYVADSSVGLQVVDVSRPSPVLLGSAPTTGRRGSPAPRARP